MATVSAPRVRVAGRPMPSGRPAILAVILAVLLALYAAFRNDFLWPSSMTYDLAGRLDQVYNWIVDNQDTSWIFVYFFNYISNFLDWLESSLEDLLSGMTWLGVTALGTLITLRFGGWRVALLVLASFVSFGVLGLWTESMQTLALMASAVVVALAVGIPLGVVAGRSTRFQAGITPVLDAMQIVPAFAYLMPVVILFSVGAPAAVIATVIYAIPPAVRITALGIRGVPPEAVEMSESLGATDRQVLGKVQLPLARRALMLAVNQTIMMALGMVVIASLIGGGGLGDTVISALTYLDVGQATLAGAAIVILAIALDRATEAIGARSDPMLSGERATMSRRTSWLLTVGVFVAVVAVTLIARAAGVGAFPANVTIGDYVYGTTVSDWLTTNINSAIAWIQDPNEFVYPVTSWISDHLVTWGMDPLKNFLQGLPWWAVIGGTVAVALVVSGVRQAITAGLLLFAVGVMGVWEPTMDTASQVIVATILTLIVGVLVGIWAAESPRVERMLRPLLDALQTLPQFVYLIPVVALFNVGRVPGVIASVLYAAPVVIRLVTIGIREVPHEAIEAAESFGATRREVLTKVKIPLARPAIMLGVNQGIVMVLAVVIVAGLVGGGALGYGVVVGLQRNEFGAGMVASLAILALGIVLDRVTQGGVAARRPRAAG
jgi:glycine betaine/proline transport system permease protein